MKLSNLLVTLTCATAVSLSAASCATEPTKEKYSTDWESLKQHKAAPDWFADAKLGIYFHWGVYSVPAWGTEWYPRWMYVPDRDEGWGHDIYEYHKETYGEDFHYHDFIPMWEAPKFSAKEWVDMFDDMGAKFIGSIAEHHDGFSMWDSEVNEWNSKDMGPGIDVVEAIANETRDRGLKFMATFHHGYNHLFYPKNISSYKGQIGSESNPEMGKDFYAYDPTEVPQDEKYKMLYSTITYDEANDYWLAKLDEVIDRFCPDYIWMDFGQRFIKESHRQMFLQHYFNKAAELDREVVVNTKGEFFPTELAVVNVERATMEDITPDVWITDFILGSSWCYNRANRSAINPNMAIRMLAEVVSKNGVMLLSAGPMADGTIPEEQVEAMEGIGRWMNLYGEAIYNTRPFISYGQGVTELKRDPADEWNEYGAIKAGLNKLCEGDVRYTYDQKSGVVYAIQLGWAEDGIDHKLVAFNAENGVKVKSVQVLGVSEKIEWNQSDAGLSLSQPSQKPAVADAAIVYKIEVD
ncbi:MAG: alpha-L-fucosidase [Rikenellaceae bacterium]